MKREKAGNEKALKALARSLQLDFGPIAEALQTFFDAPSQAEAQRLIERLPELLPDDPQSAVILEQAIAEAYGDAVQEDDEDVVVNKAEKCPECGRWLSASGACTDCAAADKAVAQGENPDSSEIKAAEIGKGKAAIKKCLETQQDVYDAISRSDLGMISFLYGNERMGLAHFQHRQETMEHLAETLILGQLGPTYQQGQKRNITYRGYTATLRLQDAEKGDKRESWVLTAFGPNDKK